MNITLVTGNAAKVKEISMLLDVPLEHQALDLYEVQSLDLKEIVEAKAREAYRIVKKPVLVEDTSLVFNALHTLPGPLIKWFQQALGNEGLCRLLDSYSDRSAYAEVSFGYFDGETFSVFSSGLEGSVSDTPRGEGGFGWDPIFISKGNDKTRAELNEDEYTQTSIRKVALASLKEFLG